MQYRKLVIDVNLARSFPKLTYNEIKEIRKSYYKFVCDLFLESIWAISSSSKKICKLVELDNIELLDKMSAESSKVILMMGHAGNWELIGSICGEPSKRLESSFAHNDFIIAFKKLRSDTSNYLFSKIRMANYKKFNVPGKVVESKRIVRHVLKSRDRKGLYIFIADQSPMPGERVVARFLNQPTLFLSGPEYLAKKLNLPVAYLGINRVKRGKYVAKITKITDSAASLPEGDLTRAFAELLERDISTNKYNWLWSHRRWKRELTPEERETYNNLY